MHPLGALLTARLVLETVKENEIEAEAIGGLTLGADPIVSSVAVVSEIEKTSLPGFIVRREAKGHGAKRLIEGWQGKRGSRVIVVDDVCTTGSSIIQACESVESVGYEVAATICIVDREEGGANIIRSRYEFYPIFTATELLDRE